jgi:hypothetical protein
MPTRGCTRNADQHSQPSLAAVRTTSQHGAPAQRQGARSRTRSASEGPAVAGSWMPLSSCCTRAGEQTRTCEEQQTHTQGHGLVGVLCVVVHGNLLEK